jgi:hypothetical protein
VKSRSILLIATVVAVALIVLAPVVASANSTPTERAVAAQGGPSATPNDPTWLGFAAARDALSEKINQRITLVKNYTWAQVSFPDGMLPGCTTIPEGVNPPPEAYFGWRYLITLLNNNQYEVRVSFDLLTVLICDKVTVGTTTTSGTPGAPGVAVPGALEVGGQVQGNLTDAAATAARTAKMTWIKRQVRVGEDATGMIADFKAKGFKVFLSVIGDKAQVMNASYHDTYATYVAGLARAGADAIQVWNEQNIDREWPNGQISGANYVALLKKAYPAIKAANANTIVVTGAPAPTGAGGGGTGCIPALCNDDAFYAQMAAAGAAQFTDCIGVHYNEGVVSPKNTSGDPRDNYPTRYFQSMLSRALRNFPGMRACFSELGYLSPDGYPPLPGLFAWGQNTSVAEQAQWLAEAVVLASQLGNVRLIIVFNLDFKTYGDDPQAGYAIIRADGSCPACTSLGATR